ncbi:MAG: transglycosylase domain-containing protein [Treponema sp.]|nr:transglycosylase domain-containing protein [Treponema sp.]
MKKKFNSVYSFVKIHKKLFIPLLVIFGVNYAILVVLKIIPFKELNEFRTKPVSTRLYDCDNHLIQIIALEDGLRREWTDIESIPKEVQKLMLKAEDKRFYFHHGVDIFAVLNAFRQNTESSRTVRGASTITMQLAKMIYPEENRTFAVKIKDAINAIRIEAKLSKKQILELYLNSVPFGYNCEGITSAARMFYGKELKNLSTEEISCLSVITRRPKDYNPITNPKECAQRASLLNPKEDDYEKLLATAKAAYIHSCPFLLPHYVNYLRQNYLSGMPQNQAELHLAVSLALQQVAENALNQALEQAEKSRISNGAILVLNNEDNSVIAWVGNGNFFDVQKQGQIDGITVQNQPGSSMKPFLYALALDTKAADGSSLYYPSMVLPDVPLEFGEDRVYIPQNFNNRYNGPIRMRIALASSLNVPAVDLLDRIGVENYLEKLYQMNFTSLISQADVVDLGLALGVGEVTLAELAPAFSVFVRDGLYLPLSYEKHSEKEIKKIQKKSGNQIYTRDTARILCSILSDKGARALGFGYTQTFQTEYPSIFKTGTSNQFQDIVALGATKEFTVAVWMGNHTGETVMGKTGSSLPAAAAKQILDYLEQYSKLSAEEKQFPLPENYEKKQICSLSGMPAGKNCPGVVYEYVPKDLVQDDCNWHVLNGNKLSVIYPSEYQKWVRLYDVAGEVDYTSSVLTVNTPKNKSVFYYSNMNQDLQAIPVEVFGGQKEEAVVEYDDEPAFTIYRPFYFLLPVERGSHKCKISCDDESTEIFFEVK